MPIFEERRKRGREGGREGGREQGRAIVLGLEKKKGKQSTEGTQCRAKYNWDFDILHIIGKLRGIACMCVYACMWLFSLWL